MRQGGISHGLRSRDRRELGWLQAAGSNGHISGGAAARRRDREVVCICWAVGWSSVSILFSEREMWCKDDNET